MELAYHRFTTRRQIKEFQVLTAQSYNSQETSDCHWRESSFAFMQIPVSFS
jgi:hypothetical protein